MTQQNYAYTNVIRKSIALYFILELPNEYDVTQRFGSRLGMGACFMTYLSRLLRPCDKNSDNLYLRIFYDLNS
jgi:hypothetical protein